MPRGITRIRQRKKRKRGRRRTKMRKKLRASFYFDDQENIFGKGIKTDFNISSSERAARAAGRSLRTFTDHRLYD